MKFFDKDILHLDRHLVIVNKPAGIVTQRDPADRTNSVEDALQKYLCHLLAKPKVFCHPVHRLDKNVSGILVFATSSKALSRLQQAFRERDSIEKTYYALVEGRIQKEGTLRHYLEKKSFHAKVYEQKHPHAKEAVLSIAILLQENPSLIAIQLHTGRYHQIRAQLGFIGHPICGDQKYGAKTSSHQIDLHHGKLIFSHPVTKSSIIVVCKPPFLDATMWAQITRQ